MRHKNGGFAGLSRRAESAERLMKYPLTGGISYNHVVRAMKILGFMAVLSLPGESYKKLQSVEIKHKQKGVQAGVDVILAGNIGNAGTPESK